MGSKMGAADPKYPKIQGLSRLSRLSYGIAAVRLVCLCNLWLSAHMHALSLMKKRCSAALYVLMVILMGGSEIHAESGRGGGRKPLPSAEELAKLPADGGPKYNRLVFEKSPYLLQHAANPVDWRPWNDEAFEAAEAQDKPVFLSVGYATLSLVSCHGARILRE